MAQKKTYWEMQKSFWKTPAGIAIWLTLLLALFAGGIVALNFIESPYPVIEFFHAKPAVVEPGAPSRLSWSVAGASLVQIDQDIGQVDPIGSVQVYPSETTTYRLTAINDTRNRSVEVKVIVHAD